MKTQTKIALITALVSVSIVLLFGIAIYYFLNNYSYHDFYKRLETRASICAKYNLDQNDLDNEKLKELKEQHLERLDNEKEYFFELNTENSLDSIIHANDLSKSLIENIISKGNAIEKRRNQFYVGSKHIKNNKTYIVVVSAENYYVSHHLLFLQNILIGGLILAILVVLSLSIFYAKNIFNPIKSINSKVKQISTENIHLRLERDSKNNSEISELAGTFNDLLDRIETAFETQKNFISNASHELGTPLTSIIGEADVALLKDRSINEYKESLKNILLQAERLDEITKSLLFLAQTGYKGKAIVFEMIRIDEIIWDTNKLLHKLNPAYKISVDLSLLPEDPKKLKVKGNKQLLQLALANILSNGCKYSSNKPVSVFIASSDSQIIIIIEDQGIGIPESEINYIYDPFFRASNTKLFEGFGIGLPLARNVINLHKGQLVVSSKENVGTTVKIKLPIMEF